MTKQITKFILIAVLLTITACVRHEHYHGYNFEFKKAEKIKVGETHEQQILEIFGSPSTRSEFGQKKYFYISIKQSNAAFFTPQTDEQEILEISFDTNNIVNSIRSYTVEEYKQISYSSEKTQLKGNEMNAYQQILTNIGKFNTPKSQKQLGK